MSDAEGPGQASAPPSAPIDATDVIGVDGLLSPEEHDLRDSLRSFVDQEVAGNAGKWFEAGEFPRYIIPELASRGLLGMHLTGHGCAGASAVAYGLAAMELEAGDSGLRSFVSVQGSLAMFAIWRFGSEAQKEQWLPAMAAGEIIGCFGLTEANFGSDPAGMETTATADGTDWILSGSKRWSTNGSISDVAVVWARTEDGIRGFLVPRGTPGFERRNIGRKMSLRASDSSELSFEDCRLPGDALLPEARGLRAPLTCLDEARYGIVWGAMGAARACYECALDYSKERRQFGVPVARFQLTQKKLVDMVVELNKGTLLALHLGRMKDGGTLQHQQVSLGKLNNVREALKIARSARSILGANGITLDYSVIRHMNNLETVLTYEGTEEIHTLTVGAAITGESAFH
ncbi:MAG: acyl-CoA dehydrogenase family protein [Actinobacteria bacterium]|nr:acyl-CoA dehydrogenase family protein [Actinomycetota bacterium]